VWHLDVVKLAASTRGGGRGKLDVSKLTRAFRKDPLSIDPLLTPLFFNFPTVC
jgi:hypothetical protein